MNERYRSGPHRDRDQGYDLPDESSYRGGAYRDQRGGPAGAADRDRTFDRGPSYGYGRSAGIGNPERGVQGGYGREDRFFGFDDGAREQGHHDERWRRQLRGAGQQAVHAVKRAFRGPKGYTRSDERIREDVSDRLAEQDEFDPSDIEVTVESGEVTLAGTVRSRHEKFCAEEFADMVSGVRDVHNRLRIRREDAREGPRTAVPTTTAGRAWPLPSRDGRDMRR